MAKPTITMSLMHSSPIILVFPYKFYPDISMASPPPFTLEPVAFNLSLDTLHFIRELWSMYMI